ncbi:alpha/beta fold hydrolase [Alcaligenes ammonioxydans]|jgi:predicted alpha/beta-fold hydrolase|uniref:YheT family hydrolase n=1 Tax=Alcaligenes TaxID=507 RepID=UPI000B046F53|nr:alpha/beta fold hydrolase [Alcaligenes ammonioxydans]MCH1880779.1 alpha/beta fold hydrolase [Alcaligenes ammonioxydans]QBH21333.1 alpha/beta fold hydrolase [Alcaligenes faecalis]WGQ34847.1 alpha/beta fold hydrolase [Alcaligenes faecalis]HRK86217.1 alpha/beta fold hydrolase [Alcaligenes faecalis]
MEPGLAPGVDAQPWRHADPVARLDSSACPLPAWLPGGHLQTIHGAFFARHHHIAFVRQRIDTPDGDFLDLDWTGPGLFADKLASGATAQPDAHLSRTAARRWMQDQDWNSLPATADTHALVLFHGLEGSSRSHYIQAIAQYFRARGWIVVVAHFRGCSGFPNRMARAYYSGDSEEVSFILNTVRTHLPHVRWHAAGTSLGGNAMLKYLGEAGDEVSWLQACASISVPLDLVACGRYLSESRMGRWFYSPYFLKSMRSKLQDKAHRFPGMVDTARLNQARTLRDFDDIYTAPMHGFSHALDYWTRASSKPLLRHIKVPTLVLNALNDPFVPQVSLPTIQDCSDAILLHQPAQGGHVGFITGSIPGNMGWLPARLARFFETNS